MKPTVNVSITLCSIGLVLLLAGTALAGGDRHPNLTGAHGDLVAAQKRVTAAQVAHEYKLGGHAAKAKALIDQAEAELAQALQDAN